MAPIELEGLTKDFGETRAVDDLTFAVQKGEIFGFLGPNGAGKTTTLRALLGFLSPTSGTATVLGADVRDEPALNAVKGSIGYLPSAISFDEGVTGNAFLEYQAALKGDSRLEEMTELFQPPLDRKIREYSSGNRQMLGIIQTFMHDPELVIMDEPTSGLDPLMQ
ncbi:MAG: ABC transporter ATP-binding protein, partial [Halodesulfurarchaeum sp.]